MGTRAGEILFLDINVLLAATVHSRPDHLPARRLLSLSRRGGFHLVLSGQVIREYLVVATRPLASNGLGLKVPDALRNVEQFRRCAVLLEETEAVSKLLGALVSACGTTGARIHDANIVATMQAHGISSLVTQNIGDFKEFPGAHAYPIEEALRLLEDAD
jgi:predicted nucleic acid-binding protein